LFETLPSSVDEESADEESDEDESSTGDEYSDVDEAVGQGDGDIVAGRDADILARLNEDNDMIDSDDYEIRMTNSIVNTEVDNQSYTLSHIALYKAPLLEI
jgi:hypothetical protein